MGQRLTQAYLVEHWALAPEGHRDDFLYVPLATGTGTGLMDALAARAGVRDFSSRVDFLAGTMQPLVVAVARHLRLMWEDAHKSSYPDVPVLISERSDAPTLPAGCPPIFAWTTRPQGFDPRIFRSSSSSSGWQEIVLPAAMPAVVLYVLRREELLTATRVSVEL